MLYAFLEVIPRRRGITQKKAYNRNEEVISNFSYATAPK
jgi:hypothetical protein